MEPEESCGPRPLRAIRLLPSDGYLKVFDTCGAEETPAFKPFELPQVPMSMLAYLSTTVEAMWAQHRRCMGFVLLLNYRTRRWTFRIPTQRCSHDSACWRAEARDLPDLRDDLRLAGSFQSVASPDPADSAAAVPAVAGLHLVVRLTGPNCELVPFLRLDNGAVEVTVPEVSVDDWLGTLRRNRERLRME